MSKKQHKIDRVIELKVQIFDMIRKLEALQKAAEQIITGKTTALQELRGLEEGLVNRCSRARKLVNK